ncbi:unnamed protein product [Rangifer tarandus platyrhynchus]|uniref:Secreted protein n=1 Tax=Rangifer tarandus platyrhynchus TaxID=3082113 RepID=A0ABN8ZDX6_RANTA|nr:unnamed protein product [Rangifer tarandus platyrhynchus]
MSLTSSGLCMLGGASAGAAGGSVSLELQTQWSQSRDLALEQGRWVAGPCPPFTVVSRGSQPALIRTGPHIGQLFLAGFWCLRAQGQLCFCRKQSCSAGTVFAASLLFPVMAFHLTAVFN